MRYWSKGHHTDRIKGITLFEMILVLMIISMIVVAGIRYADKQRDIAVADKFAYKLFQYGTGARDWANENRQVVRAGAYTEAAPLEYEGVQWLKDAGANEIGEPFLPSDFTFNQGLQPLRLENAGGAVGDATLVTRFWLQDPANTQGSPVEMSITVGSLYDPNVGVDDNGKSLPSEIKPEITGLAAEKVNEMMDPLRGASPFEFDLDLTGDFALTGETRGSTAITEKYLRIDGENYMTDNLDFIDEDVHGNSTDPEGYGIRYVEQIEFDNDTATTMTHLDSLEFDATNTNARIINLVNLNFQSGVNSRIVGIESLNFQNNTNTTLNDVKTLTFNTDGGVMDLNKGQIVSSGNMTFMNDQTIDGLKKLTMLTTSGLATDENGIYNVNEIHLSNGVFMNQFLYYVCPLSANVDNYAYPLVQNYNQGGAACFVIKDAQETSCRIVRGAGSNWTMLLGQADAGEAGKCTVGCFIWDSSRVHPDFCKNNVWPKKIFNTPTTQEF